MSGMPQEDGGLMETTRVELTHEELELILDCLENTDASRWEHSEQTKLAALLHKLKDHDF